MSHAHTALNRRLRILVLIVAALTLPGMASAEDIDVALQLGLGYKTGPLQMLDIIGLDVHLHATQGAYAATGDVRYAPPPLLRRMVDAGYLGAKNGRGFRAGKE